MATERGSQSENRNMTNAPDSPLLRELQAGYESDLANASGELEVEARRCVSSPKKRRGLTLDRWPGLVYPGAGEAAEGEAMDPAEDNGDRSLPARQVQLPPVQPGGPLMGAIIRGAGMGAATAPFLWGMAALTGLGKASVGAALAALIAGVIAGAAVAAVAWLVTRVR